MNEQAVFDFYSGGKRGIICRTVEQVLEVVEASKKLFGEDRIIAHGGWEEKEIAGWIEDGSTVISFNPSDPDDIMAWADIDWHLSEGWDVFEYDAIFNSLEVDEFDISEILG